MTTRPVIIFDFDGTIADTFAHVIDILNEERRRRGQEPVKDPAKYRGMDTRSLLKALGIRWYQVPRFIRRGRVALVQRLPKTKPQGGVAAALRVLHQRYDISIVTSNDAAAVRQFMTTHNIPYTAVIGGIGLFGKARALRRVARGRTVIGYIGDETRDIDAAKNASLRAVAVSWGYNNLAGLRKSKPDLLVTNPKQLQKL